MIVQHCEMKGRGKCGRVASAWIKWEYELYKGGKTYVVKAACDAHRAEHEVIELIERKEVA